MSKWKKVPLGEIMADSQGSVNPLKFPDEIFDLYSIPAFDAGSSELVAGKNIGSAKQVVRSGDVLLSKIVPHIRRAWIVGKEKAPRIIASGEWIVFRNSRVLPNYLRHFLVHDAFHAEFMRTVSGVGGSLLRARPAFVAKLEIPLPPVAEQRRLAEILDAAEGLRAKRRRALAALDTLTQSLFLSLFGDPVTNPMDWKKVSLEDIVERVTKGESPKWQGFEYQDEGALFVTSENVRLGSIDLVSPKFIPLEFNQKLNRSELRAGDILINLVGASIGRSCVFPGYHCPANINQAVAVVTINESLIDRGYLANFLLSERGQLMLLNNRVEGARANISLADIRELALPLPPLALQREFSRQVFAVEKLKASHRRSLAELDALFASLQSRAFAGEL